MGENCVLNQPLPPLCLFSSFCYLSSSGQLNLSICTLLSVLIILILLSSSRDDDDCLCDPRMIHSQDPHLLITIPATRYSSTSSCQLFVAILSCKFSPKCFVLCCITLLTLEQDRFGLPLDYHPIRIEM